MWHLTGCIGTFAFVHLGAAALMVPTLVWVTIAAKLNYDIVQLNPDSDTADPKKTE